MVTEKAKNRKFDKDKFFNILFFIIVLSVFTFFLFSNINIARKRLALINEIESLEETIKDLRDDGAALEVGISDTGTDDYWEGVIRDQGYIKDGEESVVVLLSEEQEFQKNENIGFFESLLKEVEKLFNW